MVLRVFVLLLAAFVLIPSTVFAQGFEYLSFNLGLTKTGDIDYDGSGISGGIGTDRTMNFSGALGLNIGPQLRTELELSYRSADIIDIKPDNGAGADISGEFGTWAGMANFYYDFRPQQRVNPYIMAGVGLARHEIKLDPYQDVPGGSNDDWVVAYQFGAGVEADLNDRWDLVGGYRYFSSFNPQIGALEFDYGAHEFLVGLKYQFY